MELTAELDDNHLWLYRLRTRDDEGAVSAWSPVKSTLVNFAEDAPAPFDLTAPASGAAVAELDSLLFQWQASSDPDWESSITYHFELFESAKSVFSTVTPQPQIIYHKPLTNEAQYRWMVTALDNTALKTAAAADFSFITNTTPTAPAAAAMPMELMPPDPLQFTGAADPNPADRLTYTLEIAADGGFGTPLVRVEGLPHAEGVMKATLASLAGQDKLSDDRDYFFRVRAVDNHGFKGGWSEPVKFRFNRANDAPGMAKAPFAPVDSTALRSQTPTFSWQAAEDEDLTDPPSSLVYDVQLFYLGQADAKPAHYFSAAPGVTTFTTPEVLRDNTLWMWQVRARDDDGAASDWSSQQVFLVNVQEDAPTAPILTAPKAGQQFNHLGPIDFVWGASQDVDYRSSVSYRLEYGTDAGLAGAKRIEGLREQKYNAPYPLQNTTYYWRVTAVDNTGLETASAAQSFTCDTRPSMPRLVAPSAAANQQYAELTAGGALSWASSTDPDPQDKLTYVVEVGKELGQPGESVLRTVKDVSAANLPASPIAADMKNDEVYSWRVKAVDNHGIESAWSGPMTFTFNPANDAPAPPRRLIQPADGEEAAAVNLAWEAAADQDLNDVPSRLGYVVELCADRNFSGALKTFTVPAGQTALTAAGLTDDTHWHWRVKTRDPQGAESPYTAIASFIFNSANDAPSPSPGLISPADGATVAAAALSWQPASDKDLTDTPDKLSYRIELSSQPDFTGERKSFTSMMGQTTAQAADLTDDARWYWRVVTVDNDGAESPPSASRSFILNTSNDAPEKVGLLLSPKPDEVAAKASLSWSPATDRDDADVPGTLSYEVEISTASNFSMNVTNASTPAGVTLAEPAGMKDNAVYYWRVRAVDKAGAKGAWSETGKFVLNAANDAPQGFELLEPADGAVVIGVVRLKWTAAVDVDPGDTVTYTVILARDAAFTQQSTRFPVQQAVEFRLPEASVNAPGVYHWKVWADDGHGGQAWSNVARSFTVAAPAGN